MKTRLFPALCLSLILVFTLSAQALAVDVTQTETEEIQLLDEAAVDSTLQDHQETEESLPTENQQKSGAADTEQEQETTEPAESAVTGPDILVNGSSIKSDTPFFTYQQTTYISMRGLVEALYPDAVISWTGEGVLVQAEGLTIHAIPGKTYMEANGRYLYIPAGIVLDRGVTLVPLRTLAKALGASVSWDASTGNISISPGSGPIESGDSYYKSDAVYWLSHIINAESGSQPLAGQIAVGTVILNRVQSPLFPNTIYDVIFDCRSGSYQFSPARSGAIHKEPNTSSIIAAKLCLDGAREAGKSLFFNAVGQSCWASRNRSFVTVIGNHSFFE